MTDQKMFTLSWQNNIAIVKMDDASGNQYTCDEKMKDSLKIMHELRELENHQLIKAVIFISEKSDTFLTCTDINANVLQSWFNQLQTLRIPTLAAINGYCLGGGLEFALSCSARIAKESESTLLGLPDMQIGTLPVSGGIQKLISLIGYPAIDFIVSGKNLTAAEAYELGVIDKYVSHDKDLLNEAISYAHLLIANSMKLHHYHYYVDISKIYYRFAMIHHMSNFRKNYTRFGVR